MTIPGYAIFSHTLGKEEMTFDIDFRKLKVLFISTVNKSEERIPLHPKYYREV